MPDSPRSGQYIRILASYSRGLALASLRERLYVVRRVLLRRNLVIDAETAQLVSAAVQAALRAGAPSRRRAGADVDPLPTASRSSDGRSCPERKDETLLSWLMAAGLAAKRSPHTRAAYGR